MNSSRANKAFLADKHSRDGVDVRRHSRPQDDLDAGSVSSQMRHLHRAMAGTLNASAIPYGYTITIWSSGALLMGARGAPRVTLIFAFAAGAVGAFWCLGALARRCSLVGEPSGQSDARISAGRLHWFAVGGAVGTVALLSRIPHWWAWPVSSFAATSIYLIIASAQLAAAQRR